MTPRHFGLIPKSVRRTPIKSASALDWTLIANAVAIAGVAAIYAAMFVYVFFAIGTAQGRERYPGQFAQYESTTGRWFRELMQPDNPAVSCCGEADAYHADDFAVVDGQTVAIITDTRDDAALGRIPRPVGTRVIVPAHKYKFDRGNPTGHGVIFIGGTGQVLCYVPPGGV